MNPTQITLKDFYNQRAKDPNVASISTQQLKDLMESIQRSADNADKPHKPQGVTDIHEVLTGRLEAEIT